ncbi:MAG: SseB family protein [Pseudomonadota bacterium]
MSPLVQAYLRMQASPGDERARMAYFARLADARLFVPLEEASDGERIAPLLSEAEGVACVQAYENVTQLAADQPTPHVELDGRDLARMLGGSGLGLSVNGAGGHVLSPQLVAWFSDALDAQKVEEAEAPVAVYTPRVPDEFLARLSEKLAAQAGLAEAAWLVDAEYRDETRGPLVIVVAVEPGFDGRLRDAISEAAAFQSGEPLPVTVAFLDPANVAVERVARVGLRFDLPKAERPPEPKPPGMDPETPPRLR